MAEMLILKFDTTYGAHQALAAVRALEEMKYVWVDDVAVVEHHQSGRYSTHTAHGSVSAGAAWGGFAGLFVGLLFPPVGFLAIWAAGMGAGALIEKATKMTGLPEGDIEAIRDELSKKGTSALILLGPEGDVDEMTNAFAPYKPVDVTKRNLPNKPPPDLQAAFA